MIVGLPAISVISVMQQSLSSRATNNSNCYVRSRTRRSHIRDPIGLNISKGGCEDAWRKIKDHVFCGVRQVHADACELGGASGDLAQVKNAIDTGLLSRIR